VREQRVIGVLFAIGSLCFALAAMASQWSEVPRPGVGATFFAGSIFFTSAAFLQWRAVPARPRGKDWLAGIVQFAGTLFFNISTYAALSDSLSAKQSDLRVWTPDVFGSICFLVASELALAAVCGRWLCRRRGSRAWRIAAINLAGSVAFAISAAAALVDPSTNEPVDVGLDNAMTSLGAWCFLAGALLLLPAAPRAARGGAA
jgi:hypothetical protein